MENDAEKRSILISGITKQLNIESILNAFSDINVTGGGVIQSYEFHSPNRIRITYFFQKDAERVLSRGSTYKIGKIYLTISRFSYDYESSYSSNSSLVTAIVNSSRANTPLEIIKPIDQKRILLTNVPNSVDKEYLDLYLEYLSDEVEIERIDVAKEIANSIVITYSKFIDFENLKKKHKSKPKILKNTTTVLPVYLPNTVVLELEEDNSNVQIEKNLNAEILELYFSNKKRSGGNNAKIVKIDSEKNLAFVTFENFETAKQVCNRKHLINGLNLIAKLYYENIGADPFSVESKIKTSKPSEKNKAENKEDSAKSSHLQARNIYSDHLSDSQRSTYTIESDLNNDSRHNSMDKPKVNLPSLDDPILSFEEYAILNNISFKPDISYGREITKSLSDFLDIKKRTDHRPDASLLGGKNSHQIKTSLPPIPKLMGNNVIVDPHSKKRMDLEATLKKAEIDLLENANNGIETKINNKENIKMDKNDQEIIEEINDIKFEIDNGNIHKTNLDQNFQKYDKKEPLKFIDNVKVRTRNEEDMIEFILKTKLDSNKMENKIFVQQQHEPDEKAADLKNESKNAESKFQQKVDAIKKIIQDPLNKDRSALEELLFGEEKIKSSNGLDQAEEEEKASASANSPNVPIFKIDKLKNSIEVNKTRLNQTLPLRVVPSTMPPLPKIVQKEMFNTSLQETACSKDESKPLKVILKPRPLSSIEDNFFKRDSNNLKEKNNKNHILIQYGNSTTADSINKLNPKFIQFLKSNSLLEDVRSLFKKVNINLNENQKRLYFFGAQDQVLESKNLISKKLDAIKSTVVKLNSKQLATFLKKSNTKEILMDYFENFDKNNEKYSFFSFDVMVKREKESEEYLLYIYSNCGSFIPAMYEFINKNVMVGQKLEINSNHLINSIKNEDQKWTDFYSNKYEDSIDYRIEFHKIRNKNSEKIEPKCYLKLTGFKENIDKFQNELTTVYKLKKIV